jgi:hypothetical protein
LLEQLSDHDSQFLVVRNEFAQLLAVVTELFTAQDLTNLLRNHLEAFLVECLHLGFQSLVFFAKLSVI